MLLISTETLFRFLRLFIIFLIPAQHFNISGRSQEWNNHNIMKLPA